MPTAEPHFLDLIYEAAFIPELWDDVLDHLGHAVDAPSGALMLFDQDRPAQLREVGGAAIAPVRAYVESGVQRDARLTYYRGHPVTGFVVGEDYFPRELVDEFQPFKDLRTMGLVSQVGAFIPLPLGDMAVVALNRHVDRPFSPAELSWLNQAYPHLARSAMLAARIGLERAQAAMATLAQLGLPAAVVSPAGQVLDCNAAFDGLDGPLLPRAFGRLLLAGGGAANELLQQALAEGARDGLVRSIPVPPVAGGAPAVVHVLPVVRAARDIFARATSIVAVTLVRESQLVPDASILTGLFDLTPAEVRLVMGLAGGTTLDSFARDNGIRLTTARSHLARAFEKTGTSRQSQLVALAKTAASFR